MSSKTRDVEDSEKPKKENSLMIKPVTEDDVAALKKQRALLKKFVSSQLVEAQFDDDKKPNFGEGDYGIIPGTKKRSLLKQGAEKLQKLFGLGCRFELVDKEIDKAANFAIFTYRAIIFHVHSGLTIDTCEASANSQEKKFKERTAWRKIKRKDGTSYNESYKEETPIFDILNTLQKMSQKRAMVGATLLATGGSEYFTQDMLDEEELFDAARKVQPIKDVEPQRAETDDQPEEAPVCCGQDMMISKYADKDLGHKPWYCVKCRTKKPAIAS